jgi:hypothetical protein
VIQATWILESPFRLWLFAFSVTQAVEVPIYCLAHRPPNRVAKAFGASAITHPIVWLVFPLIAHASYWAAAAIAEVCVVAVEALYTKAFGVRRAWAWSLFANVASCAIGFGVYRALGWM